MNQDDKTDQKIGEYDSGKTGDFTLSSDIEHNHLDHQQEVIQLGQ
jgi:hypothetical protein